MFKRKIRLGKVGVWELNPNRQYVLGVNNRQFSEADAVSLAKQLQKMGINNVVAMFDGDPMTALKIIKTPKP